MAVKNSGGTIRRTGRGRPFQKGVSGNPKGRPRGAKDKYPRSFVKNLVLAAVGEGAKKAHKTLVANLEKAERVKETLELAGKLNQELGVEAMAAPPGVTINFISRLDPEKFRRGALARDAGKADAEVLDK